MISKNANSNNAIISVPDNFPGVIYSTGKRLDGLEGSD